MDYLEFIARVTSHIPDKGQVMVRYYGLYSNAHRGTHLGPIQKISGEMLHPAGKISVEYDNSGDRLKAEINLPDSITATFVWKGKSYDLKGGLNKIESSL